MSEAVRAPRQPAVDPHQQLFGMLMGFWHSRALAIAAELELAEHLSAEPLHLDELAKRTKTHAPNLFRLLRALESIGLFRQVARQVFTNTPISNLLRKEVPGSVLSMIRNNLCVGDGSYEGWGGLLGSVTSGRTAFDQIYGYDYWEFLRRNPHQAATFNEMMRGVTAQVTPAATAAYDWSRFSVIADVGGGIGSQLVDILAAHPSCRGILYDQPDVVAAAIPHDRMQCIGGSFFEKVPAGADAYLLRMVIHDWPQKEAVAILKNVRQAMKPAAHLVLIENVIPETSDYAYGKWLDLHMMVIAGGNERTAEEYCALFAEAGFALEQIVPTAAPHSLIFGRPGA
jgi:O-methyltransferase domain/Dimerisation domain